MVTHATAQSGFAHVVGSLAMLVVDNATIEKNTVTASCGAAAADAGCEIASGQALLAYNGEASQSDDRQGPAVLLGTTRFAAGQDVNASLHPVRASPCMMNGAKFCTQAKVICGLWQVAAIGCDFSSGAKVVGNLPSGGAYSCEQPPPEWMRDSQCDVATTTCSTSSVQFGFECDCLPQHTRLNATTCSSERVLDVLTLHQGLDHAHDLCQEAISGGSLDQRGSMNPVDKEMVRRVLCTDEQCKPLASAAYGLTAWNILCSHAGAVVDPEYGGLWGLAAPKTEPTSELAIMAGNGSIGLYGGISAIGLTVNSAELYDIALNSWRQAARLPLPTNHGMPLASSRSGRVFLAGGGLFPLGDPVRDTLFEFSEATGWHERARMPTARSAGASAELDGLLYVAGGWPPHGADFASYDPATDSWEVLPSLSHQRNHLVVAAVGGMIVAVGGRTSTSLDGTRAVEIYDAATRQWRGGTPMPPSEASERGAYSGHNGVVANGCLHVFGGEHSDGVFPEHFVYDVFKDSWLELSDMQVPVHGMVGMHVDEGGWIHLTGGATGVGISGMSRIHQIYHPGSLRCSPASPQI
eukprot:SAG31_NODE_2424_length_5724_cov_35.068978_4_plen_581_part_00